MKTAITSLKENLVQMQIELDRLENMYYNLGKENHMEQAGMRSIENHTGTSELSIKA